MSAPRVGIYPARDGATVYLYCYPDGTEFVVRVPAEAK